MGDETGWQFWKGQEHEMVLTIPTADNLPLFHESDWNQIFYLLIGKRVQPYKAFQVLEKKCKLETVYCELLLSL